MGVVDPVPHLGEPHVAAVFFDNRIEFIYRRGEGCACDGVGGIKERPLGSRTHVVGQ